MAPCPVILVSMPWNGLHTPSIQLGLLQALLDRQQVGCRSKSYYLEFPRFLAGITGSEALSVDEYLQIADTHYAVGLGEWIFAVPPLRQFQPARDRAYFDYLRQVQVPEPILRRAWQVRLAVPSFLQFCVSDILQHQPRIVGFSSMFSQNSGSLVLAQLLKAADPAVRILFGGANCQGPMGAALFRNFPQLDAVVRGEAERVLPRVVQQWLAGEPLEPAPGLCFRQQGLETIVDEGAPPVPMGGVPLPDYDEYFQRLERHPLRADIERKSVLPFESSRGCWWGAKSHCSFCGLNGAEISFRSKSPEAVWNDMLALVRRYRRFRLFAVDNILDGEFMQSLLPKIRAAGLDLQLFYEVKANLKKDQLRLMSEAGLRDIQPGIESFSNPVLKLMRKGTTALQNIRLLKWSLQYGIEVWWNLIYGLPGEPPDEYPRMAETLKLLTHLQPPHLVRLSIDRFSPYHQRPEQHGLKITGPIRWYQHVFELDKQQLSELAYQFECEYLDGRDPEAYIGSCRQVLDDWNRGWPAARGSLAYRRGPDFLVIQDRRVHFPHSDQVLEGVEAKIYLACDAGASAAAVRRRLAESDGGAGPSLAQIRATLDRCQAAGWMFREEDRYLSLAVRENYTEVGEERATLSTAREFQKCPRQHLTDSSVVYPSWPGACG